MRRWASSGRTPTARAPSSSSGGRACLHGHRRVAKAEEAKAARQEQLDAKEAQLRPAEEKAARDEAAYNAAVEGAGATARASATAAAHAKGGGAAGGDGGIGMGFAMPDSDAQAERLKRDPGEYEERRAKRACAESDAHRAAEAARGSAGGAKANGKGS